MKPHIKKISGYWYCGIWGDWRGRCLGMGYTPSMAYDDWADLTRNFWRNG